MLVAPSTSMLSLPTSAWLSASPCTEALQPKMTVTHWSHPHIRVTSPPWSVPRLCKQCFSWFLWWTLTIQPTCVPRQVHFFFGCFGPVLTRLWSSAMKDTERFSTLISLSQHHVSPHLQHRPCSTKTQSSTWLASFVSVLPLLQPHIHLTSLFLSFPSGTRAKCHPRRRRLRWNFGKSDDSAVRCPPHW